jgi:hypothetical protein
MTNEQEANCSQRVDLEMRERELLESFLREHHTELSRGLIYELLEKAYVFSVQDNAYSLIGMLWEVIGT